MDDGGLGSSSIEARTEAGGTRALMRPKQVGYHVALQQSSEHLVSCSEHLVRLREGLRACRWVYAM